MAAVGIFAVHLAGSRCQQVLQGPKTMFDPVAPLPCPDEPRHAVVRSEAVALCHVCALGKGWLDAAQFLAQARKLAAKLSSLIQQAQ